MSHAAWAVCVVVCVCQSLLLSEGIKVGTGQKALLGAIAAGVAGLGTQPFDVIKTLEMIDKNR